MKNEQTQNNEIEMEAATPRLKQLIMAFHPASCRSIQNTISNLRDDLAQTIAA